MKYLIYGFIIMFIVLCVLVVKEDVECSQRGGHPSRIGCVKKDIFLDKQ